METSTETATVSSSNSQNSECVKKMCSLYNFTYKIHHIWEIKKDEYCFVWCAASDIHNGSEKCAETMTRIILANECARVSEQRHMPIKSESEWTRERAGARAHYVQIFLIIFQSVAHSIDRSANKIRETLSSISAIRWLRGVRSLILFFSGGSLTLTARTVWICFGLSGFSVWFGACLKIIRSI